MTQPPDLHETAQALRAAGWTCVDPVSVTPEPKTAKGKREEQAAGKRYACHVDGEQSDDCVIDEDRREDCSLSSGHRTREGCPHWRCLASTGVADVPHITPNPFDIQFAGHQAATAVMALYARADGTPRLCRHWYSEDCAQGDCYTLGCVKARRLMGRMVEVSDAAGQKGVEVVAEPGAVAEGGEAVHAAPDAAVGQRANMVEAGAKALWLLGHPEDGKFSLAAPNDWGRWPETPRAASLVQEDYSKEEYREQAAVVIDAVFARLALLEQLVRDCRNLLAARLDPEGMSKREVIRRLLARLNGPQGREAMGEDANTWLDRQMDAAEAKVATWPGWKQDAMRREARAARREAARVVPGAGPLSRDGQDAQRAPDVAGVVPGAVFRGGGE